MPLTDLVDIGADIVANIAARTVSSHPTPSPPLVPFPHPDTSPSDVPSWDALPAWIAYAIACAALDAYGLEHGWVARAQRWGWDPPAAVRFVAAARPVVTPSQLLCASGVPWVRPVC